MSYPKLESFGGQVHITQAAPDLVREVQTALSLSGLYQGGVDGIVGKGTLDALAKFKRQEYLQHPQMLGATTAKVLLEAVKNHPVPSDTTAPKKTRLSLKIPGISTPVYADQPIYNGSRFTWGEATKGLSRIPASEAVVFGIIRTARHLDDIRGFLGDCPITINSWYRPPAVNRAVGGVSNSRHLVGDAVDFVASGIHPYAVYDRITQMHGKLGGLGKSSAFTHLDMRGYAARFRYGK